MELISLSIKNFMSIKDVRLELGQINQIVGFNSQGKTTILKALETAAKGSTDGSLVTFGEDKAEIIVELPDQVIRRTLNSSGKQAVTVTKGEFKVQSPQTYLENLFDFSAFNPLELLEPKRRTEAILKSIDLKVTPEMIANKVGIDVGSLPQVDFEQHGLKVVDDLYKYFYSRRAEANKVTAEKKTRFETYKKDTKEVDAPKFTRAQISKRRDELNVAKTKIDGEFALTKKMVDEQVEARITLTKYQNTVKEIDAEILKHENEIKQLKARRENGTIHIENLENKLREEIDLKPYQEEIEKINIERETLKTLERDCDVYELASKQINMLDSMEHEYNNALEASNKYDKMVSALSGELKKELMDGCEMPIKGLEYKEGIFTVDGTPVDNLSSSLTLKLAISVARKLSKKTKMICIDGSEMLDEVQYKALIEEIKGDGYTYFITRVGSGVEGVNNITMNKGVVQ